MPEIAPPLRRLGALLLLCSLASAASAQWAWRDENGRKVYSDQPPPAGVKVGDILQQPSPAPAADAADAAPQPATDSGAPRPASNPAQPTAPPPPTMAEREQEFRKRMKERADADKKLADAQAEATQKSDECDRARGYLKSLEGPIRLVRTNPDGSREMLDSDQREAEAQRAREVIQSSCN